MLIQHLRKELNHLSTKQRTMLVAISSDIGSVVLKNIKSKHLFTILCQISEWRHYLGSVCDVLKLLPQVTPVFIKPCPMFIQMCQSQRWAVFFTAAVKWVLCWTRTGLCIPHLAKQQLQGQKIKTAVTWGLIKCGQKLFHQIRIIPHCQKQNCRKLHIVLIHSKH